MTTKQNPEGVKDTMMCVYTNGISKTVIRFYTYSFFCFSSVGTITVSVTHLDTLRDDFEQAQRTPVLTIHAPTVCDALYSSEDVSLAYPRVRVPTLEFLLPWG